MVKGAIHSIETFGSVDGPGIRFIVFLKGCKLRCKYCHNADTWDPNSEDMRTPDELLDFAERYRSYWGTEGGITVSGGEPLLQIDFLIELFKKAKERGINTCIDTALQPFTREEPFFSKFEELMKYTDLLLVDIKHIDKDEHIELTGLPNDNIFDGFKYLSDISKPIWIRHVLVPGITDDDEYLKRTREFIETLSNVQKIEVLPYHSMGQHKFETLGIPYKLDGVKSPSKERVENAMKILNGK
ncbi:MULTISPECIES: pyruvate formate-lyase-activating protein [unclassified Butyrivibrio]|uniref:pyruvate formate-lyase-activating protein n=1 Tax=unclassified Butyrivibrio TaxID=2639466 RepID=UPI00047E0384|nr:MULTISPECIES: pyruvate formate-lyase-activating protein [unclassified Butyrivibrio]